MNIQYNLKPSSERRNEPFCPEGTLPFGKLRTDHMFLMDYHQGEWINPRIEPYGPLATAPGSVAFHYGQSVFEGAKAFMHDDGEIYTFRLDKNAKRLNISGDIICIPPVPQADQIEAIHALIDVDRLWFPQTEGGSLYIRPFIIATDDLLSVKPSSSYTFCVMLSPCGAYYPGGFNEAIRLLVSQKFHRAVSGGTGNAKAAGNYAASLKAGLTAAEFGAEQVLYLDATNQKIEEAGAMNHFHVRKDGSIIIPEFTDTILRSITSESIIELAKELGTDVRQESIYLKDFVNDLEAGEIVEAGGFGTAAVISPVGSYIFEDKKVITVGHGGVGEHLKRIYKTYTDIQVGRHPAPEGWLRKVERQS